MKADSWIKKNINISRNAIVNRQFSPSEKLWDKASEPFVSLYLKLLFFTISGTSVLRLNLETPVVSVLFFHQNCSEWTSSDNFRSQNKNCLLKWMNCALPVGLATSFRPEVLQLIFWPFQLLLYEFIRLIPILRWFKSFLGNTVTQWPPK